MSAHAEANGQTSGMVNQLDLETLRAAFPNWRLGGSPDYWFAVRGGVVPDYGPRSLLRCYLSSGKLVELAEMLCLQEYLDSLGDSELGVVWRHAELPRPSKMTIP